MALPMECTASIYSISGGTDAYWSDELGWTTYQLRDVYTASLARNSRLPIDGHWEPDAVSLRRFSELEATCAKQRNEIARLTERLKSAREHIARCGRASPKQSPIKNIKVGDCIVFCLCGGPDPHTRAVASVHDTSGGTIITVDYCGLPDFIIRPDEILSINGEEV